MMDWNAFFAVATFPVVALVLALALAWQTRRDVARYWAAWAAITEPMTGVRPG